MAGHSKWANIKRKKGAADAARGKVFTKLVREVTTAARLGGGDPDGNPRLRAAIAAAKAQSMPASNIDRAIKKGTGDLKGQAAIEEVSYEGYGPGGVAVFVEAQTDNRNRTSAEVKAAFTKCNGNLGSSGNVSWLFHKKGQFVFDGAVYTEDQIMEAALEAGAEDVSSENDQVLVVTDWKMFSDVLDHFDKAELKYEAAEITMIPENSVKVSGGDAEQVLKLVERLEDLDDVQKVHANFDIDDEELARIAESS